MASGYGSNFMFAERLISEVVYNNGSCLNLDNRHLPKPGVSSRKRESVDNASVFNKKANQLEGFGKKIGVEVRSRTVSDETSSCLDEELSCTTCAVTGAAVLQRKAQSKLEKEMQKHKEAALLALEKAKKYNVVDDDLRATLLRSRYADTIVRAQQKMKNGTVNNAAVTAELYKSAAEAEVKRQLQKQREAARKALEDLEKSVDVEDNFKVQRDFEALIGCLASESCLQYVGSRSYSFQDGFDNPRFVHCR